MIYKRCKAAAACSVSGGQIRCIANTERYRSGHNGADSKSVCLNGHVGSNPTRSATSRWTSRPLSRSVYPSGIFSRSVIAPFPPKGTAAFSLEKHSLMLGFSRFTCLPPFRGSRCAGIVQLIYQRFPRHDEMNTPYCCRAERALQQHAALEGLRFLGRYC